MMISKVLIGLGIFGLLYLIASPFLILFGPRHSLNFFDPYTTGEAIYYEVAGVLLRTSPLLVPIGSLASFILVYLSNPKEDRRFYALVGGILGASAIGIWIIIVKY